MKRAGCKIRRKERGKIDVGSFKINMEGVKKLATFERYDLDQKAVLHPLFPPVTPSSTENVIVPICYEPKQKLLWHWGLNGPFSLVIPSSLHLIPIIHTRTKTAATGYLASWLTS